MQAPAGRGDTRSYLVANALFQWEGGERHVRDLEPAERLPLERATDEVLDELRRRLGSSFTIEELAALYGSGADWAGDLASRQVSGPDASYAVDAAFARYAREAVNFGGGRYRAS